MKNDIFDLQFDEGKGLLTSLVLSRDPEGANFIKNGHGLCEIHSTLWYGRENGKFFKQQEDWQLTAFHENASVAVAEFSRRGVAVKETFTLTERDLRISIKVKNNNFYPVYFKREDFSFYTPFADSYDDSITCQRLRCHAHMAPFLDNSYIRLERMGESEHNLGLLFLRGAVYSYSQEDCPHSNDRGFLYMNVEPFSLVKDESYELELTVFPHKGGDDFFIRAAEYEPFINVKADPGYVLLKDEEGALTLTCSHSVGKASVRHNGRSLPFTVEGNVVRIPLCFSSTGEKRISYEIDGRRGEAYLYVSMPLAYLQKKRAHFIVKHQQCTDERSPLYGAYLIWDNEEKRQYFSFDWMDHNANRERMVMALFLVKYLRKTGDRTVEKSLRHFTDFLLRECVDEEVAGAYNNIGRDAKITRLYNAPWVILYFCELYRLDKNQRWLNLALRMAIKYYKNGGTGFYPNGIRFREMCRAFEESEDTELYREVLALFDRHVQTLIEHGTNYPPHEVNYEQSIVTPAACLLLDKYIMEKDERYLSEAEKHLRLLKKFNGAQPDYRLNKVPIRYWDNYWFGKTRTSVYGDTLPHPAMALSAHVFHTYGRLTGDPEWIAYGVATSRSGYCLFQNTGEAYSSYVYPERVNGDRGRFFDPFANEQDGFLYLAYKFDEEL